MLNTKMDSNQDFRNDYPKILNWSWREPNKPTGAGIILYEILKRIPEGKVETVCEDYKRDKNLSRNTKLNHPVRRLQIEKFIWPFSRGYRIWAVIRPFSVIIMVIYGLYKIFRFKPECIFSIYYRDVWIWSSYILSLITRLPLVYYVLDIFIIDKSNGGLLISRLMKWLEPRILKHATVLVLTEGMSKYYYEQYGFTFKVLRHPAMHKQLEKNRSNKTTAEYKTIGYAGEIYNNVNKLLFDLLDAIDECEDIRLRLWTGSEPSKLAELGLTGKNIAISFEPNHDRLLLELSNCDLLYVPLNFANDTKIYSLLKRAFPTKTIDYLIAGPDILVHCPREYELFQFFSHYNAGYLLDKPGVNILKDWLYRWSHGEMEPIPNENKLKALDQFDPDRHARTIYNIFRNVCRSA